MNKQLLSSTTSTTTAVDGITAINLTPVVDDRAENDEMTSEPQGEGATHNYINLPPPMMTEVFERSETLKV